MNRKTPSVTLAAVVALAVLGYAWASEPLKVNSRTLAGMKLAVPSNAGEREYLGLSGQGTFTMPEISTDVLIVEVFSMYCPICQATAEETNKLHELIERDPALRGKVKLIGVGIGNTPFEVNMFRKKFHVAFPLFADDNSAIREAFSEPVRTPTFIIVELKGKKKLRVLSTSVGKFDDAEAFLKAVTGAAIRK